MNLVHHLSSIRLEHGGVVRAVLDLCEALAERGHKVTLITSDPTDVPAHWDGLSGHPNTLIVAAEGWPLRPLKQQALGQIRERIQQADAVHLHEIWNPTSRQLAALCQQSNVPYVITPHGMLDDWCMAQKSLKKRIYLALGGRRLLEQAMAVHCTAQAEADQASQWFPRGRAAVVPLIFDLESFQTLPGSEPARATFPAVFSDDRPIVLFLSRLHEKKGVHVLIDAARHLRDRGCSFTLAIGGSGEAAYEQQLREQSKEADLNGIVHFLGFVSGIEKVSLYQAADVFALPTSQENWGFVSLEAMAAGTPVITTRGVDIWPELQASGAAIITENSSEAFADAIQDMLENANIRSEMADHARQWVFSNLNNQEVVNGYEQLYCSAGS